MARGMADRIWQGMADPIAGHGRTMQRIILLCKAQWLLRHCQFSVHDFMT